MIPLEKLTAGATVFRCESYRMDAPRVEAIEILSRGKVYVTARSPYGQARVAINDFTRDRSIYFETPRAAIEAFIAQATRAIESYETHAQCARVGIEKAKKMLDEVTS